MITKTDIIRTYSKKQQKLTFEYLGVIKLRKKMEIERERKLKVMKKLRQQGLTQEQVASKLGVRRRVISAWEHGEKPRMNNKEIANMVGTPKHRVERWIYFSYTPWPIKACKKLEKLKFLPLKLNDNRKICWLARICGFMFGDGHLSRNLNNIEFCGTMEDLRTINKELKKYFGCGGKICIITNDSLIKSGYNKGRRIKGTAYLLRFDYGPLAHLLCALGVPRGNKTKVKFYFPKWTWNDKELLRGFTRALLWTEIATPKIRRAITFDKVTFTMNKHEHIESIKRFLGNLRASLEIFGIETKELTTVERKNTFGFYIKTNWENILRLAHELPPVYASDKEKMFKQYILKLNSVFSKRIEEYIRVKTIRNEYGWGYRRIARALNMDPSTASSILYKTGYRYKELKNLSIIQQMKWLNQRVI